VSENTREHNERRQERDQVFENTRQQNKRQQERILESKDSSNEVPNQYDCSICWGIIDLNDRSSSMRTQCNQIFHRNCLERWMEEKVRF
jgi:hypothetical protein